MNDRPNLRDPWPWYIGAFGVLVLGILVRDEAASGPAADPFNELVGFLLIVLGIVGVVGAICWKLALWTINDR